MLLAKTAPRRGRERREDVIKETPHGPSRPSDCTLSPIGLRTIAPIGLQTHPAHIFGFRRNARFALIGSHKARVEAKAAAA
ncbi:hypothetical protein BDZ89DRAFT_1132652 [Hymenopellis radicata]|nr:hypothetical protein BDZ89DRAFT_1146666 [Hymenopellis radicata]KAF9006872.1 hypothetical protein BDZ89DRAFT_1144633 [Hymenopellis radicata]KAF9030005.1 hypothetical protein BDZ89DRAFT_1132652 [Hymenopellis radicata]